MGLESGATTFRPKGENNLDKTVDKTDIFDTTERSETSRDSFNEYKKMVDKFHEGLGSYSEQYRCARVSSGNHAVIDDENMTSTRVHSSLPSQIGKYAAEIWYPESRDCRCCQGFKYGCACITMNRNVCRCVSGISDDVSVVTMNSYDIWYQQLQSQAQCLPIELQFNPKERRRSKRLSSAEDRHEKTSAPCRFFFSAAGCRYGDKCTFSHTKQE